MLIGDGMIGVARMQLFGVVTNTIMCAMLAGAIWLAPDPQTGAANPPAPVVPEIQMQPEMLNFNALAEQGKALLEKARVGNGSAGITLANYKGHYTMLTARTKSGGGELHKHFADFLFVIDGEGTELTGGTMVNAKELPGGEVHGTTLEGATPHTLHKGDVIHVPAGTPHQAIEAPGQTITIYVIKVQEPESKQ